MSKMNDLAIEFAENLMENEKKIIDLIIFHLGHVMNKECDW